MVRSLHYVKHDVIHKIGNTQHIALPSEEDRATTTGNVCRIFGNIFDRGILRYASGETNRHTDTLITILCTHFGVK